MKVGGKLNKTKKNEDYKINFKENVNKIKKRKPSQIKVGSKWKKDRC